jgi:2-(1,2-epoxy-1,2-dihydrophenyl)acetyl-CoA isomerase
MNEGYASRPGLQCAFADGVLRLTFDRADKRNALTDEIVEGVIQAIVAAGTDEAVRAVVLSGTGDHFCSGFDIVARNIPSEGRPRVGSIQRRLPGQANRLIALMLRTQVPIICVVRGWSAGIGLALALAADFTLAADDAKFWAPFLGRGFTPDSGITWMLPRRVGDVRAREMLLLGRVLTGVEAAECSLIHGSIANPNLDDAAESLISQLAMAPTVSLGLTKSLLAASSTATLESQLQDEAFSLELSSRSDDFKEGLLAFKEKRDPDYKGR